MVTQFLRTSGLDQLEAHSIILLVIGISAFCAGFGWLASWVSRNRQSGVGANAVILFASMSGGLVAFNHFVSPLQKSQGPLVVTVAIGTAVAGLLLINILRCRPLSA